MNPITVVTLAIAFFFIAVLCSRIFFRADLGELTSWIAIVCFTIVPVIFCIEMARAQTASNTSGGTNSPRNGRQEVDLADTIFKIVSFFVGVAAIAVLVVALVEWIRSIFPSLSQGTLVTIGAIAAALAPLVDDHIFTTDKSDHRPPYYTLGLAILGVGSGFFLHFQLFVQPSLGH